MIKIHHMTHKKAAKLGFKLEARESLVLVRAIDGGSHILATANNANEAMRLAIEEPMLPPTDGSVVKGRYKKQYGKDASCGDEMAVAVNAYIRTEEGINVENLHKLAADNALDMARWAHLNIGQQSMSVRNCLRGMLRRGERSVVVGDLIFHPETEDEKVAA